MGTAWLLRDRGAGGLLAASLLLALGLVAVVLADYRATRGELLELLGQHAAALRQTVAAAARSNREAALLIESQLAGRLLETARLLGELDRTAGLSAERLDAVVAERQLFRVTVFDGEGRVERSAGLASGNSEGRGPGWGRPGGQPEPQAAPGRRGRQGEGQGGRGPRGEGAGRGGPHGEGAGRGGPRGGGAGVGSSLLAPLLAGQQTEAVSDVHASRGGAARLAAGVARTGGGAILVNVDASQVTALERGASLEALLADIVRSNPDLAYVRLHHDDVTLAEGEQPGDDPQLGAGTTSGSREVALASGAALEFYGPVALAPGESAELDLGMRLDGVRRAQGRMLGQLALSLAAGLLLSGFGVGTLWLRRKYALLSAEHARAEEALRRRDRLAAMGELASAVAHEVRNPLNAVAMGAQRLRHELLEALPAETEARREAEDLVGTIASETRRLDAIVQQFLEFARPPRLAPRPTDVRALLRAVTDAHAALAESRGVRLELDAADALESVVDPERLRAALDNLLRNALEATAPGGQVRLAGRNAAGGLELEVADSGHGITAEELPRIFDLYFTTKPDGTGLGLPLAQQVATAHGGALEVDSRPGVGTRMTLRLPHSAEARLG